MRKMGLALKLALMIAVITGCVTGNFHRLHRFTTASSTMEESELESALATSEEKNTEKLQKSPYDQDQIPPAEHIRSCNDLETNQPSGRYMMTVWNSTFAVYCEQELNGGGWTVIQNRFDGSVDFNRNWTEYVYGFGSMKGEFWLGLTYIFQLTASKEHELMVLLEDFNGNSAQVSYSRFEIRNSCYDYELRLAKSKSNMDALGKHRGRKFSTYDRDNDSEQDHNCAQLARSGWWHGCYDWSNLNGEYKNGHEALGFGTYSPLMTWWNFERYSGLKKSKMMIREVKC